MLTDRQQKFYAAIKALLPDSSTASLNERRYLYQAAQSIEKGVDFKKAINQLDFDLKDISNLTPKTKALYESLVAVYGEPVDTRSKGFFSENWELAETEKNPDLVFTGKVWQSKKSIEKENEREKSLAWIWFTVLLEILFVLGFLGLLFILLYTPIPLQLEAKLGKRNFYIAAGVTVVVILLLLIVTGQLRSKNRKKTKDKPTN